MTQHFKRGRWAREHRLALGRLFVEISTELHGDNHRVARARGERLWQGSLILEADEFEWCIREAKRRALSRNVDRLVSDPELAALGLQNRVPYFFAILERMVGPVRPLRQRSGSPTLHPSEPLFGRDADGEPIGLD
jgi:hypothetical protein